MLSLFWFNMQFSRNEQQDVIVTWQDIIQKTWLTIISIVLFIDTGLIYIFLACSELHRNFSNGVDYTCFKLAHIQNMTSLVLHFKYITAKVLLTTRNFLLLGFRMITWPMFLFMKEVPSPTSNFPPITLFLFSPAHSVTLNLKMWKDSTVIIQTLLTLLMW